jgi:hypothetical protein
MDLKSKSTSMIKRNRLASMKSALGVIADVCKQSQIMLERAGEFEKRFPFAVCEIVGAGPRYPDRDDYQVVGVTKLAIEAHLLVRGMNVAATDCSYVVLNLQTHEYVFEKSENRIVSTRSSASEDARGWDVDEELRRFRLAVEKKDFEAAAELGLNLDESMTRGGAIPVDWLGPPCMRTAADMDSRNLDALKRARRARRDRKFAKFKARKNAEKNSEKNR